MKQKSTIFRRTLCFLLVVLMLTVCAVPAMAAPDYKADWQKSEQQLKKEKEKYAQIKEEKQEAEEEKKSLQNQKNIIQSQIQSTVSQVNTKLSEIAVQEQAIAEQQNAIDERWSDFQDRMLAMQMLHDSGAVAMLSNAKSMYELLSFSMAIQQVSQKDTEVLEDMKQQKELLEQEKQKMETARAELQQAQNALKNKEQQLAWNIHQQNENISEKDAEIEAQAEVVEESKKKVEEAEARYEEWIKQNQSSGSGQNAEGFIWPLPAPGGWISTEFGATQDVNGLIMYNHKGLDIVMPLGTPILASHDGTVSQSKGHPTYGNVVMLDNGDGISTLYAHMQSMAVSVGQKVKQGDVIGYVGVTGRTTGAHLHFEVRVNGQRQNPRNYVTHP